MRVRAAARAFAISALMAVLAAAIVPHLAPPPAADVARGSEEPFAEGLQPREFDAAGLPHRWTGRRLHLRFRNLPSVPATLQLAIRGHRSAVAVAADGAVVATLPPEQTRVELPLPPPRAGRLEVILSTEPFAAEDGRQLGLMLDRAAVVPSRPGGTSWWLILTFIAPALAMSLAAIGAGVSAIGAAAAGSAAAIVIAAFLWPAGLLRSSYADRLPVVLVLGAVVAFAFGRWQEARRPGAGRWAFAALLAAFYVQVVGGTHPLMVVGDAQFHVHKLYDVHRGDFFPTSVTQHGRPFHFPYGVSFYALLAPLVRWRIEGTTIVRFGAAVAGLAGSAGLFAMLAPRWPAAQAAAAVWVLQAVPITFDVYSYGNLNNIFGQALTVLFFGWWEREPAGRRWPVGALLLAAGCLAHFSSLIVLVFLVIALLLAGRHELRRDRRWLAAVVGLTLAAGYYLHFWDLVVGQLPRLLEGGGQGRGASRDALDAARLQVLGAVEQWALPAIVLAWIGRPRPREGRLERDLAAFWALGPVFAVLAIVTPVDVRYLYALTLPLSIAAAEGLWSLAARAAAARLLAAVLVTVQVVWASWRVLDALLWRYRA
jgi:hypothetical protein